MSVVVIFEIQFKPEAVNEAKAFMKANMPETRGYAGCQGIDVYENLDEPGNLIVYQRWDTRAQHEKYLAWRTEEGGFGHTVAMGETPPSIRYFERVDA
jgi:quinol monooxygenase YgiN